MISLTLLSLFIGTFFIVSITPGMCMTLAFSLGMSIGYKRTLWMMAGELLGVAVVAISAVLGIASLMLNYPWLFVLLKTCGAVYLIYLGGCLWFSKSKLSLNEDNLVHSNIRRSELMVQGFVTAIANPKGWAFMISLLPPFIDRQQAIAPQLAALVCVILLLEFICMTLYATGGKGLKRLLTQRNNLAVINRISAILMVAVAIWLFLG